MITLINMGLNSYSRNRRNCQGEFMDGHCSVDVTQSESDLPDFNQSEHYRVFFKKGPKVRGLKSI